jgi:CheY-like chemotaxis protein
VSEVASARAARETLSLLQSTMEAVIAKPFDPMQLGQQILAIWEGLDHGRA